MRRRCHGYAAFPAAPGGRLFDYRLNSQVWDLGRPPPQLEVG